MRNMKFIGILVSVLILPLAVPAFGQHERVFNWLPGNDETVRLDPANYHAGPTYRPGGNGGNMQVDVKAELEFARTAASTPLCVLAGTR